MTPVTLLESIGLSILHSLWQVTLIVLVIHCLLGIKHLSSQSRYILLLGGLFISFMAFLSTMGYYLQDLSINQSVFESVYSLDLEAFSRICQH